MKDILEKVLFSYGKYKFTLEMLVSVALIIVAIQLILVFSRFTLKKHFKKHPENKDRLNSVFQLGKYLLIIIAFLSILDAVGIKLTILLAGSAALLVGLGLGLQQTFNDLISGIIILAEGGLQKNDVVEVDGLVGRVIEIRLRTSNIYTRDGIHIIVPNHKLVNENVINWSHQSKATRFRIQIGVGYESDELLVQKILKECLAEEPNVIQDDAENFPIYIRITEFADSAINFEILFWSHEIFAIEQIKSNIRFTILKKFRANKISIPYPQSDIHIIKDL